MKIYYNQKQNKTTLDRQPNRAKLQSLDSESWDQTHAQNAGRKKKYAFTLAEVLVTMGVIGVVAAMTIPTLMNNYQQQVYVTSLHKVYNETSQALVQLMTDKNADNLIEAGLTNQKEINNWVKSYFKITTDCSGDSTKCFAPLSEYANINGTSLETVLNNRKGQNYYSLASGAVIRPLSVVEGSKIINILVDTNGKKGPNVLGRDLFWIALYNNGLIDDFKNSTTNAPLSITDRTSLANNCASTSYWGCFSKILNDGWQMKY